MASTVPAGDPGLSQNAGPAALDWQNRPQRMPQFMGMSDADAAAGQLPNPSAQPWWTAAPAPAPAPTSTLPPPPQPSTTQLGSVTSGGPTKPLTEGQLKAAARRYSSFLGQPQSPPLA